MKTFHTSLSAQYQAETSTLCKILTVTRLDGDTWYFTDHDQNLTVAGHVYLASPGLRLTASHSTDDLSVNTLDATIFLDNSTEETIEAGIWDEAAIIIAEIDWSDPPDAMDSRVNVLMTGVLGTINRQNLTATIATHGLSDLLKRRIGRTYTATCPWYHAQWNGVTFESSPECGIDLTMGYLHYVEVSAVSVTPHLVFSASNIAAQPNGYFDEGFVACLTGANAGLVRKVRHWESPTLTLHQAFPYPVQVGDTFTGVIGDDHTGATCKNIFNNKLRFGGFEYIPGIHFVYNSPVSN